MEKQSLRKVGHRQACSKSTICPQCPQRNPPRSQIPLQAPRQKQPLCRGCRHPQAAFHLHTFPRLLHQLTMLRARLSLALWPRPRPSTLPCFQAVQASLVTWEIRQTRALWMTCLNSATPTRMTLAGLLHPQPKNVHLPFMRGVADQASCQSNSYFPPRHHQHRKPLLRQSLPTLTYTEDGF